jgi:hypothetical protein
MATPLPSARSRVFPHPWRVVIVATVLFAVGLLGIVVLRTADTSNKGQHFPIAIDDVTPEPGNLAAPSDTVVADLSNDLTGVLKINGAEVPEDQTDRVVELGEISFRPGADKDIVRFPPGEVVVEVLYWPRSEKRPKHPQEFAWSFNVGA